ncbi:MAG: FAD binding domain-containing protein, partial [Candidatus Aminicenantes bacterium]|nr:FAD binding domain-containing protein [Candidatus Aminicenantes bacterium]
MRSFAYGRPESLAQAAAHLAEAGAGTFVMGGGTDLLGEIKEGTAAAETVLDLKTIPGLAYIRKDQAGLAIGATTTIAELAEDPEIQAIWPALHQAAAAIASPQLRNVGTVGGNLCQRPRCWYYRDASVTCRKKGGAHCFAEGGRNKYHAIFGGICYAVHPSDLAPVLAAFEAELTVAGAAGERVIPVEKFFAPPIVNVKRENGLDGKEIVKEIRVRRPGPGDRSAYIKLIERGAWDFALVSAAVRIIGGGGAIRDIRIVCGGVAAVPLRLTKAEDALKGSRPTEGNIRQAVDKAAADAAPLSENGYKIDLLRAAVIDAVMKAAKP